MMESCAHQEGAERDTMIFLESKSHFPQRPPPKRKRKRRKPAPPNPQPTKEENDHG
jgi:hypothetical protein